MATRKPQHSAPSARAVTRNMRLASAAFSGYRSAREGATVYTEAFGELLHRQRSWPGIGDIVQSLDDKISPQPRLCNACGGRSFTMMGRRSDGVDVLRCEACGLGVIDIMPSYLASLYDNAYYGVGDVESAFGYQDYRFTAEHGLSWAAAMVRLIKSGGRVLDMGCADGTLLAKLPDSFELYGIEVNALMAARAAEAGTTIIGGDLLAPDIARRYCGSFDLVTAIAAFEHLVDLRRGIHVALQLIKPDGVLLFEMPYISAQQENRIWFESSLEHVYYPSGDSLHLLVEALGAHLVGREVYIRNFASNFIGLAVRDSALIPGMQQLFARLTSTGKAVLTREQRLARLQLMLIHAAESTPELVSDLPELLAEAANPALLQRVEQLWENDLRRLAAARQAHASAEARLRQAFQTDSRPVLGLGWAERCWTLQSELGARDAQLATTRAERDAFQAELGARDAQLVTTSAERDVFRAELGARYAQLAMTRAERDTFQAQLATTCAERDELQYRFEEVLDGTAWKVTYPFRRLGARHPQAARLIGQALKLVWWSARLKLRSGLRGTSQQCRHAPTQGPAVALQSSPDAAPHPIPPLDAPTQEPVVALQSSPDAAPHPIPPLVFSRRNGLLHPISCDDEMEPWPADRPLVTVVIPSFNYGRFIGEAVDSVLAQTFTNIEVIVVEGGSTDPESRHIALALDRPRVRMIEQYEPHLVGANRNFGICQARGKYVCCLDADDMLAPTYIEKAVFLLEVCGYDVVSTAAQFFGDCDERVGILEAPDLADMLEANHILTCAVFRRSLWRQSGGYRDTEPTVTGHVPEDWMFWVRLAALGARMRNICREYLFLYRRHGPSLSAKGGVLPAAVHRVLILQANADLLGPEKIARSGSNPSALCQPAEPLRNITSFAGSADRRRPVLLLALPFMILGGAERLLSRVVDYLSRQGWRVAIITSLDAGRENGDTTHWFEPATAEIYHLPRFLEQSQWRDFARYLICSRSVDVLWIVGSTFCYDLLSDLRAEFPRVAVADLLFNTVGHAANNRKHAQRIDLTFVENGEVLRYLQDRGEAADRITLVPSGVDLHTYQPRPRDATIAEALGAASDELIVGYCGRWSVEKNPLAFIEIARRSLAEHLPLRFVMTGAGPLHAAIIEAIHQAAMPEGRFHLLGELENLLPYLRSCDVLVVPSKLDGRPVVVLEALALGVPVLASRVGGLPELIEDGVNGFLQPPPGNANAFVRRLRQLAGDPPLLARMKLAARRHAESHLGEAAMLIGYESRLRQLVEGARGNEAAGPVALLPQKLRQNLIEIG